jgi:DNA polymerase-3 subunit delta'
MSLVPLFGHTALQARFRTAVEHDRLPGSLLLHGARGVGKQRLALWLGQLLLCSRLPRAEAPCGVCQHCRYVERGAHPDLHWYFPRPRLKDGDAGPDEVKADIAEGIAERMEAHGLYAAPSGSEAIFVATVRAIVQSAGMSPAMASRKVYVMGDAERMVAQEGSDQAANAFLKLLEEPPANTTIMLTSSEPGALLPTIRSRVVNVRVAPLGERDVRALLEVDVVRDRLRSDMPSVPIDQLVAVAAGAPGRLFAHASWTGALTAARAVVDAAQSNDPGRRAKTALSQGSSGARGGFSDMLDALTTVLHEHVRAAANAGNPVRARGSAQAVELVERAKEMATGNVNPQLITADLLRGLTPLLQ